MLWRKGAPQVSEIVDHFDALADFAPEGMFEPFSCLSVTCEVETFVRGYASSHLLEVLMRGIECRYKVVVHAVSSGRDQDIICKNIAYNLMTSHKHDPGAHDMGHDHHR